MKNKTDKVHRLAFAALLGLVLFSGATAVAQSLLPGPKVEQVSASTEAFPEMKGVDFDDDLDSDRSPSYYSSGGMGSGCSCGGLAGIIGTITVVGVIIALVKLFS